MNIKVAALGMLLLATVPALARASIARTRSRDRNHPCPADRRRSGFRQRPDWKRGSSPDWRCAARQRRCPDPCPSGSAARAPVAIKAQAAIHVGDLQADVVDRLGLERRLRHLISGGPSADSTFSCRSRSAYCWACPTRLLHALPAPSPLSAPDQRPSACLCVV